MATIETYALPSRLYRFRPLEDRDGPDDILDRELKAITGTYIYCPTFDQMNDPMEGLHRETKRLRDHRSRSKIVGEVQGVVQALGIASFSETHENEPMWAHYAEHFRGMCVAYSFSKLRKSLSDEHQFVRMLYTEEAPIISTSHVGAEHRARLLLSAKNLKWSSEREWRLIQPQSGPARYRDHSCVVGVYLGARVPDARRDKITKVLADLSIPVYAMKVATYETSFSRVPARLTSPRRRLKA